ncbi:F0F1 ATP synthase subunit B family protein [Kordiimonas pumila]|uniref:ATP synthase subunit b n=1 Tax=Kordiimonas pumila TaxID=2161677 RepID=A0ABV7D7F7_9PROT|nr:F0F1 ATP synthase subunit B [Kordiimonas pumila]
MASGEMFYADPTFWVGCSFVVFVGGVVWLKAHKSIAALLDAKSEEIRKQIEEAKSLRDEAETLLHDYQRKQRDAESDAAEILAQAESDAKIMIEAAKTDLALMIDRREKSAANKIKQAEAAAVKEVKAVATEVAIKAATSVLAESLKGKNGKTLVDAAISEVEQKLH